MKPRTKFEKAVIAQSGHLRHSPPLPVVGHSESLSITMPTACRKVAPLVMDCGHSWLMTGHTDKCTCPNCKAQLEVKETFERKCQQKSYLNVIATCGEYQILRMFLMEVNMRKGFKASSAFREIGIIGLPRRKDCACGYSAHNGLAS